MSDDYTRPDGGLADAHSYGAFTDQVDDILGQTIDDRYEIVSRLGAGGMGFVYEARDLILDGRVVVIKMLRPELVNNETTAERFTREAMAQAAIDHPNVIRVDQHGVTEAYGAYYVMERLTGQDLGARLTERGPLSVTETLRIAAQVASALGAAHARGIIHRDLKPENIFLVDEGGGREHVKVLDFGLARLLDAGNKLTETGAVIGTPRYMAPEQTAGEKADVSADVYSMGLVMHEMLTGKQPYAGLGTYEILGKKMFEDPAPPSALDPPVILDPRVEAFVMRCLAREPSERPAPRDALGKEIAALREALQRPSDRPPAAPEPTPAFAPQPASTPAPAPSRGVPWVWIAALFAALLTGAVVLVAILWGALEPRAVPLEADRTPTPAPAPISDPTPAPAPVPETIIVDSEPAGAEVRAAGRALGVTPATIRVPDDVADGSEVELVLEGYQPRRIQVSSSVPHTHVMLHPVP